MTIVVMMTLVRWDDRGEEMNQEEADQDVADEVSVCTLQLLATREIKTSRRYIRLQQTPSE